MRILDSLFPLRLYALMFVGSVVIALTLSFDSYASPVSDQEWKDEPEVKKVRAIYSTIQEQLKKGEIIRFSRRFNDNRCAVVVKEIGLSRKARVRYFRKSVIERGLTVTTKYYYDGNGKLRFVFIYYNSHKSEGDRVYYDKNENIIFAVERKGDKKYIVNAKNTLYRKNSLLGGFIGEKSALTDFQIETGCEELLNH